MSSNNDKKSNSKYEYLDCFINAIKNNDNGVINKESCIEYIQNYKDKKIKIENEKNNKSPSKNRIYENKKQFKQYKLGDRIKIHLQEEQEENKRKQEELEKIQKEKEKKKKQNLESDSENENENPQNENKKENNSENNNNQNDEKQKGNNKSSLKKFQKESESGNNKEEINENNSDNKKQEEEELNTKRRKARKLFGKVFKSCRLYLESNGIMINDFMLHNPFQSKPFEYKYSVEFLKAVKFSDIDTVKELLNQSKNYLFSYDYYRQTAYHWAAKLGDIKMLTLLINSGTPVNQKDIKSRTPLYLAALNNQKECVFLLLEHQANPYIEDINGKKPGEVTTDVDIKVKLNDAIEIKYVNPVIKTKIERLLREKKDLLEKKNFEKQLVREKQKMIAELNKQNRTIMHDSSDEDN